MKQIYTKATKNKFSVLLFIFLISNSILTFGQAPFTISTAPLPNRGCGTGILPQQFETWLQNITPTTTKLGGGQTQSVFNIPVIVHVIHNNESINSLSATSGGNLNAAQIQDQINILNQDFNGLNADTALIPSVFKSVQGKFQFNFCLAVVNPTGGIMAEPGIDRVNRVAKGFTAPPYSTNYIDANIKPNTIWNVTKYMNMWVCGISGSILGYATFPNPGTSGLSGISAPYGSTTTDGLVMRNNAFGSIGTSGTGVFNKGRTAVHEIGHWLGLRHIWGDNGQCGATDYCNDTPPQRGGASPSPAGANYNCPTFPHQANTCTISGQSNVNGDMFMNYMDYTNDACMYMFTNDQKTRAQLIMTNSPMRLGLLTSTVCNSPSAVDDIGIMFVTSPTFSQVITCSTSINPSVTLFNYGTNTISSATFSYNVNGVGTQTWSWLGSIAPSSSLVVGLPTFTGLTNGIKVYNVGVYLPNGNSDPNMNNNVSNQPFTIAGQPNLNSSANTTICLGNVAILLATGASSFTWFPGNSTINPISVSPTITTTFTVYGSNSLCTVSKTVEVNVGGSLSLTVNNQTICSGSSATIQATGASSYSWNTGNTSNAIAVSPSVTTVYTVIGTSGTCSETKTVSVTIGALPISINSLTLCPGNSGSLVASGATNYTWSTGSTNQGIIVSPTVTTTYSVLGDNGTCTGTAAINVTVAPNPTINVSVAPSNNICTGTPIVFNPTGACSYTFSSGSNTITPTSSDTYTILGTDCTNGCLGSSVVSVTVSQPTPLVVSANSASICSGANTTFTANGATTYSWSNGNSGNTVTVSPISTTTYSVYGFGGVCTNTGNITLSVTPTPTLAVINQTICLGITTTITASGASSYSWDSGSNSSSVIVTPTTLTVYTVTGNNLNCTDSKTVSIDIGPALSIPISGPNFICSGNSATLTASGADTYTWNDGSNNPSIVVSPTANTIYSISANNATCAGTAFYSVSVNPNPTVTIVGAPSISICPGSSINLIASGATSYTWNTNANTNQILISPTVATNYNVIGITNGCVNSASIAVTIGSGSIPVSIVSSSAFVCAGTNVTLTANGAVTYTWDNGANSSSIVVSPTTNSTYSVNGSNGACQGNASTSIFILNATPLSVTVSPSSTICLGNSITMKASGNFTNYTWSSSTTVNGSSISITPSANISYTLNAYASGNACSNASVFNVVVNNNPITTISVIPASCGTSCNGKVYANASGGTSPYSYSLTGATCTSIPCNNLCAGLYSLVTTDSVGCKNLNIFSISNSANNVVANITATHATCSSCNNGVLSVNPSGGNAPYTYSWSPIGGTTSTASNLTPGCYTVTVSDAGGCNTKAWSCIGIGTGIDGKVIFENELLLFPNPTKNLLNIQMNGFVFDYHLYSSLGQLIAKEKNINNSASINVETLANGIYFVEITVGDAVLRKKIVKE